MPNAKHNPRQKASGENMNETTKLDTPPGVGVDAVVRREAKDPRLPRTIGSINPLRAPIAAGDRILVGGELFLCDTDMRGKWKIYKNYGKDGAIHWQIEAENIDGQIELISWFERPFATFFLMTPNSALGIIPERRARNDAHSHRGEANEA